MVIRRVWLSAIALVGVLIATQTPARAGVVISQIYGGGGNTGAQWTNDYVELFNNGNSSVSLIGLSIQYASATGTGVFGFDSSALTPLSGSIAPGQYLLIQEASNAAVGSPLPTPDIIDATPIAMSATAGKVALANSTSSLGCNGGSTPCSAAQLALIIDLIGYGNANFFEGAGAAPTLTNTTAAFRLAAGCTDTNNNSADFQVGAPAPRNSASTLNVCQGSVDVPEPSALLLLASALIGLVMLRAAKTSHTLSSIGCSRRAG